MNWKVILKGSLYICAFYNIFWLPMFLLSRANPPGTELLEYIIVVFAFLLALIAPSILIGKNQGTHRFANGVGAAVVGWTINFPAPVIACIASWSLVNDPGSVPAQGLGLIIGFACVLGILTSPVGGLLTWVAGKKFDRAQPT